MGFGDPMVLPADVVLVPVDTLPPDLRARLACRDGDYALTRPRSRATTSIVDAGTAGLLRQFREPTTIVDAVIRFSRLASLDPRETLDSAFPVLQRFMNAGLLLDAGSELTQPIERTYARGDPIGAFQVVEALQVLVDTEVYLARTGDGTFAAVKIARAGAEDRVRDLFEREAGILRLLDGGVAPRLLVHGETEGRPFLATAWCQGVDALDAAAGAGASGPSGRAELLRTAAAIAHAYARLHAQGVLQGDVHPRNILVGPAGEVTLVDFGMAVRVNQEGSTDGVRRGVIDLYIDPELAAARLAGEPAPPFTAAAEQYAVAALLFLLVTGSHTHDFSLESEQLWRQVVTEPPLAFAALGVEAHPAIERTLRRALAKTAAERFPSTADFAAEFACAVMADLAGGGQARSADQAASPSAEAVLDDVLARLALTGPLLEAGIEPPTASVNNGAAGFAWFLLRLACLRGDERLLALADVWANRAVVQARLNPVTAFTNAELDLTPEVFGERSVFHTVTGVHCVAALVARMRGDATALREALAAFVAAAGRPCPQLDVAFGRAGLLMACSLLLKAGENGDAADVRTLGDGILAELWQGVGATPPGSTDSPLPALGAAHGWAGVLFAVLRWSAASGTVAPEGLGAHLDALAGLATPVGRGLCWPRTSQILPAEDPMRASWCNGAAGFVHLWTAAERHFGNPHYGRLAHAAAWTAFDAPQSGGDLCCGLGGRSYALLDLHRHIGDPAWRHRARDLAERAARRIRTHARRYDSLYHGAVGVALLAADLADPDQGGMPLFHAAV